MNQFKLITMTDGDYFQYGAPFLATASKLQADIVCYYPDESLSNGQRAELSLKGISIKPVSPTVWEEKMQYLKFRFIANEMTRYGGMNKQYKGIAFCDFDVFFTSDFFPLIPWDDFDIGITVRENEIKKGNSWALSNGGVIFMPNTERAQALCKVALDTMLAGHNKELPQYDELFNGLESTDRPERKRCLRTDLHWNVDQVFLSALIKYCIDNNTDTWKLWRIMRFTCDAWNRLDSQFGKQYTSHICHLKKAGRDNLK